MKIDLIILPMDPMADRTKFDEVSAAKTTVHSAATCQKPSSRRTCPGSKTKDVARWRVEVCKVSRFANPPEKSCKEPDFLKRIARGIAAHCQSPLRLLHRDPGRSGLDDAHDDEFIAHCFFFFRVLMRGSLTLPSQSINGSLGFIFLQKDSGKI
jgi:hypothetical protein